MQSKTAAAAALALGAIAFAAPARSADLPQAGSFATHSAGKADVQGVQVGDKHFMATVTAWFVVYNDAGSGPLHRGNLMCKASGENINGSYDISGVCAFGDAGGADKIFVGLSGKGTDNVGEQGSGPITGGSGKYAGIQGKIAYQCKPINRDPVVLYECTQQWDYQLKPR
jgi:hypothetical protein